MMMVDHQSTRPPSFYHHQPAKGLFTMTTGFPIRKPRAKTVGGGSIHFAKDLKDTMHHVNIINIVAAVNDSRRVTRREQSDATSEKSGKTTVDFSNVVFPHEHSTAVISQQRVFEMPGDAIQKKPVYYKHSEDQEVKTDAHMRVYNERHLHVIRRKKVQPPESSKTSIAKIVKNLPVKPQILDSSFLGQNPSVSSESHNRKSAFSKSSRSISSAMSVRQLGSLKKHSEPRMVHDVAKCDVIDLLDPTIQNNGVGKEQVTSGNNTEATQPPQSSQTPVPYLRTKSLPIIFPAKNSKPNLTKQESLPKEKVPHVYKDRPLSQTMRKSLPVSLYRTMLSQPSGSSFMTFSINNGFNEPLEVLTPIIHHSQIKQLIGNQIPKHHQRVTAGIYHMNRSKLRNPLTPKVGRVPIHIHHPSMKMLNGYDRSSTIVQDLHTLQRSKTELHEQVKRVMSGKQDVQSEREREVYSAKSRQGRMSSRSNGSDLFSDNGTPRKGQSNGDAVDTSFDVAPDEVNEIDRLDEHGGLCIIQSSTSANKAFIQDVRPMSSKELLRIQQRILPANQPAHDHSMVQYAAADTGMTIRKVQLSSSSLSSMSSNERHGTESGVIEAHLNEPQVSITDKYQERHGHKVGDVSNKAELESMPTIENYAINIEEGKVALMNEHEQIEYYKIVKAVDLRTYEGYEHKKMRRSSAGSNRKEGEPRSKVHYVKVKLS